MSLRSLRVPSFYKEEGVLECWFYKLHKDLVLHVFVFLLDFELLQVGKVSKGWSSLSMDERLWKRFIQSFMNEKFGGLSHLSMWTTNDLPMQQQVHDYITMKMPEMYMDYALAYGRKVVDDLESLPYLYRMMSTLRLRAILADGDCYDIIQSSIPFLCLQALITRDLEGSANFVGCVRVFTRYLDYVELIYVIHIPPVQEDPVRLGVFSSFGDGVPIPFGKMRIHPPDYKEFTIEDTDAFLKVSDILEDGLGLSKDALVRLIVEIGDALQIDVNPYYLSATSLFTSMLSERYEIYEEGFWSKNVSRFHCPDLIAGIAQRRVDVALKNINVPKKVLKLFERMTILDANVMSTEIEEACIDRILVRMDCEEKRKGQEFTMELVRSNQFRSWPHGDVYTIKISNSSEAFNRLHGELQRPPKIPKHHLGPGSSSICNVPKPSRSQFQSVLGCSTSTFDQFYTILTDSVFTLPR